MRRKEHLRAIGKQYYSLIRRVTAVEDEEELERLLLGYSPRLREMLEAAVREIQEGQGQPHDAFWSELEEEENAS